MNIHVYFFLMLISVLIHSESNVNRLLTITGSLTKCQQNSGIIVPLKSGTGEMFPSTLSYEILSVLQFISIAVLRSNIGLVKLTVQCYCFVSTSSISYSATCIWEKKPLQLPLKST